MLLTVVVVVAEVLIAEGLAELSAEVELTVVVVEETLELSDEQAVKPKSAKANTRTRMGISLVMLMKSLVFNLDQCITFI